MTQEEKQQAVANIVAEFALGYWRDLQWHAAQFVPGADMNMTHLTAETIFTHAMEPQEWLVMAKYGAGLLEDADPGYIYEICQGMAEWLFSVPDYSMYSIPDFWADTDMGALWWRAILRIQGDELITLKEAAELAGVTTQAISQRVTRGSLKGYTDPLANQRQGRTLVRRSDVEKA